MADDRPTEPPPSPAAAATHLPRQTALLRDLLHRRRVAALATRDAAGDPAVSQVPYAIDSSSATLVVHLSALSAHTAQLAAAPRAALLIGEGEVAGEPVHALARASLTVDADTPEPGSADEAAARAAYTARFPEAAFMTGLGDFRFVRLRPVAGRHIAGFGAARAVDADELARVLRDGPP